MNTNVSRDVILDLLPAYLSGEVSDDTRALIETYMKQDPEFAAQLRQDSKTLFAPGAPLSMSADKELEALHKTKRLLRRRGWNLGLAIFFTLTALSYQYGPEGFRWTWQDAPWISVLLAVIGVLFWTAYFRIKHRLKPTGV